MEDKQTAVFAGGCFWCTEAVFVEMKGVESVAPGYIGGHTANPTYEAVCGGATGHAEAIRVVYDPAQVSYRDLLTVFLTTHNPTTKNRQGADVGTQYRSAIFYLNPEQKADAEQVIHDLEAEKVWPTPVVTEVVPFTQFYVAEAYHHNYYARNPYQGYCQAIIAPKVKKFREHYRESLKAA